RGWRGVSHPGHARTPQRRAGRGAPGIRPRGRRRRGRHRGRAVSSRGVRGRFRHAERRARAPVDRLNLSKDCLTGSAPADWAQLAIEGDIAAKNCLLRFSGNGRVLAVASTFRVLENLQAEVAMELEAPY